ALTYSSAGAVRGDIAQGWSLGPLPVIRRDVSRDRRLGVPDVRYTIYWDGANELVPVPGDERELPSSEPYRVRVEKAAGSRFEKTASGDWVAFSADGRRYQFIPTLPGEWRLSAIIDRWDNRIAYEYMPVTFGTPAQTVDYILRRIFYTSNPRAE